MMIIGGRTSQGKSALALQIAYSCAKQGKQTYLFSLEMSVENLLERLFCQVYHIPSQDLYFNPTVHEENARVFKDEVLKDLPLVITYAIGSTSKELNNVLEDLPRADVVIVDYIQMIKHLNTDRLSVINDYLIRFRELCVKKNFVGILVSQIHRGAMDERSKRPHLWQLKSSGALEEASDTVLLLHYPYFYSGDEKEQENFEIVIAKNRNGQTGFIKARFEGQYYLVSEESAVESVDKVKDLFHAREV